MKKYILLSIAMFYLVSCDSDFLDKKPLDAISEEDVFNDDALLTAYVVACYNAIPHGFDEAMMSSTTDETYSRHGSGSSVIVSRGEMNPDNITTFDASRFSNFNYWSTAYEQLRNINTFFEKIDAAKVSDNLKKTLTGEMKFIRAFVFANLIWRFGGVPLITKTYSLSDTDFSIKRNTYDECVDFIVKELDEAIPYLPANQTGSNFGKASADACKALKSRVLLYAASPLTNTNNDRSKWEKASAAALEVIQLPNHALYNDYRKIFLVNNSEVIFQRQFTKANGTMMNVFNSPNGYGGWGGNCPIQNLVDDYEIKETGKRPSEPGSGYDPANPYAGRDPRFDATILYNGAMFRGRPVETFIPGGLDTNEGPVGSWNCSMTGLYLHKFHDENQVLNESDRVTQPWVFFRLAEFYLNYAEAQYNLGNEEECRKYINMVRDRPGVEMPHVTASGTELLEKLRNERRIELAIENHRYYDLRRWLLAEEYENKPAMGVQIIKNEDGSFTYNPITVLERHFYPQHYWLPIPRDEITKSGNTLTQNPNYQ
ncbi:MAG: RagB/SusD family nutrient uptake outer membrane protein [Tannerella sp.]|jgi:hypothetical protein|nr:RagB/SusD family nutrient uptake outer membrane protein [Tannerella sp.]